MKNFRLLLPVLAALALTVSTASPGLARHSDSSVMRPCVECPECFGHRGHGFHMGKRPKLNAEQQKKYDAIVEEYSKKMDPLRDQAFVKRQELRALQNAANPNLEAVRKTATELRSLQQQLRELHLEMSQKLRTEVGKPKCPRGKMAK